MRVVSCGGCVKSLPLLVFSQEFSASNTSVSGSRFLDFLRLGSWIRYFIISSLISASGLCHLTVML